MKKTSTAYQRYSVCGDCFAATFSSCAVCQECRVMFSFGTSRRAACSLIGLSRKLQVPGARDAFVAKLSDNLLPVRFDQLFAFRLGSNVFASPDFDGWRVYDAVEEFRRMVKSTRS